MPVTRVKSDWSSGGLRFYAANTSEPPSVLVSVGTSTAVDLAAGVTGLYGQVKQDTTAVTGTARGVRGNASILVASASGTATGGEFRAANGTSASATDGVSMSTLIGVQSVVAGVGQSGPAVVDIARGIYVQLDIDAQNLTVSDARGIYVNVQSGNDTANTLTACNLAYLEYESVVGTAPAINSAIKIATVGGATGATMLIDATTFRLAQTDTDKVTLLKFRAGDGTVTYMRYDKSDNALAFATS
jgi:hypothetical protein